MPRPPTPVPFIQTGDPAMDRLQRFLAQALPGKQDAWSAPTLLNSWVDYGSTWQTSSYMKDSMGFVHLRGLIKSGTINTIAFTLPVGYRPTSGQMFASIDGAGSGQRVEIDSGGGVKPVTGNNAFFTLSGITFDTR